MGGFSRRYYIFSIRKICIQIRNPDFQISPFHLLLLFFGREKKKEEKEGDTIYFSIGKYIQRKGERLNSAGDAVNVCQEIIQHLLGATLSIQTDKFEDLL
jgi:hypothetical protein